MSDPARCVFDTNTLISAALFEHSTPGQALRCALQSGEILVSSATFSELAEVLQREKFDRYLSHAEREEFLDAFGRLYRTSDAIGASGGNSRLP